MVRDAGDEFYDSIREVDREMPNESVPPKVVNDKRIPFPSTNCLTPKCVGRFGNGHKGSGRGLCKRCIQQATSLVKQGKTTWQELEALGLAQPKYRSWFEQCYEEAKKKAQENKE